MRQLSTKSPLLRAVTTKTIAQRAAVHQTTVSLALRGSPKVSVEVGDRIRRLAREMGYYPRAAAQLLRSERTGQIGIVVAQSTAAAAFSEGLIAGMLGRVVDTCMSKGIRYVIDCHLPVQQGSAFVPPHSVAAGLSDGVLLIGEVGQPLRDWLDRNTGCPWVSLLEPATYWVQSAADQATLNAVEMLYRLGHRRIAHAAGPQLYNEHRLRHESFLAAARRLKLHLEASWASTFGVVETLADRLAWAKGLLDASVRPTAVVCPGAREARVLIAEAALRGLSVPRDMSVVAWTTETEAEAQAPVLTGMYPDSLRIAEACMDMLTRLIRGEEVFPRFQAIPVLMSSGETCGPAPQR